MESAAAIMLLGPPIAAIDTIASPTAGCGDYKLAVDENYQSDSVEKQVSDKENRNFDEKPPMGFTENLSPTFLTSGNPCLDFFFHVVPSTPSDQLVQRVQLAWIHDPSVTLKLIFNLRGVRGTGKSNKESFYTAALWLYDKHPKTLALNLKALVDFGYLKDLPEILYRILEGPDVRQRAKEEKRERTRAKKQRLTKKRRSERNDEDQSDDYESEEEEEEENEVKKEEKVEKELEKEEKKQKKEEVVEEKGKVEEVVSNVLDKETARKLRKDKEIAKARRALQRYKNDPNYRFLFYSVCHAFAELLKSDMKHMSSGKLNKISLASKWCPSIDSSYDKATLVCEGIAKMVFPRECDQEYEALEEAHYAYKVRDMLRKQTLVPLRKALELPEVYMSANKWDTLPYSRVASVAMKNYRKLFQMHDKERFDAYLEKVKRGEAKIAAGALLPHEIIQTLDEEDGEKVAELQWARMVEDLSKKGKLNNCIAVCDVSGSMRGTPMEVCVALGLLVSELSEEPWKRKVITFSADPQIHMIQEETLRSKTKFIRNMEWGYNTNFQKVFDRMLEVAVEGKLSEEQMIKRVFVFSDMEFDQASGGLTFSPCGEEDNEKGEKKNPEHSWETDYEVIMRKFRKKGYNNVPEIVFWNLRNSSSTPVVANQKGVALVSGFAKNLLTLFLEEGGIMNPQDVMGFAIAGQEYKNLKVYD